MGVTGITDSVAVQIVWVGIDRVYFGAGAVEGIAPGWCYCLPSTITGDSIPARGTIDQVYPDVSSGPFGNLSKQAAEALIGCADIWLYEPVSAVVHLTHLRLGIVDTEQSFDNIADLLRFPLIASLMWPWTCSVKDVDTQANGISTMTMPVSGGRLWAVTVDTAGQPEGEFPRNWGALADRLNGITEQNNLAGCPTLWALQPHGDDPLCRHGVLFEGFSYVNDTAVGLGYATPFYTFPEYVASGIWRRAVAAAGNFDAELHIRPPGWLKLNEQTWISTLGQSGEACTPLIIDTLTIESYADFQDQRLALEVGEVDLCTISIDDLLRDPPDTDNYHIVSAVQNALVVFGVNQQKDDLRNNRLTTAVSYLTDKYSLVRALLADQALVSHTILAADDSVGRGFYPFNSPKGRQLLKGAHPRRTLNFYVDTRIERGMMVAEHIAGKLAAEGIATQLIPAGPEQFAAPDYAEDMDVFLYLWPVCSVRPDQTFYPFLYGAAARCGTNPLAINETELLTLLEQARQEETPAIRTRYYREIEYRLLAESYICPLYRPITTIVAAKHLPEIRLTEDGEINMFSPGDGTQCSEAGQ